MSTDPLTPAELNATSPNRATFPVTAIEPRIVDTLFVNAIGAVPTPAPVDAVIVISPSVVEATVEALKKPRLLAPLPPTIELVAVKPPPVEKAVPK